MAGSHHTQRAPTRTATVGKRNASSVADRRRTAEADLRRAIYVRPGAPGYHVVRNVCNDQEYQVADGIGGTTHKPGSVVALGSFTGNPGEILLGRAPAGFGGASSYVLKTAVRGMTGVAPVSLLATVRYGPAFYVSSYSDTLFVAWSRREYYGSADPVEDPPGSGILLYGSAKHFMEVVSASLGEVSGGNYNLGTALPSIADRWAQFELPDTDAHDPPSAAYVVMSLVVESSTALVTYTKSEVAGTNQVIYYRASLAQGSGLNVEPISFVGYKGLYGVSFAMDLFDEVYSGGYIYAVEPAAATSWSPVVRKIALASGASLVELVPTISLMTGISSRPSGAGARLYYYDGGTAKYRDMTSALAWDGAAVALSLSAGHIIDGGSGGGRLVRKLTSGYRVGGQIATGPPTHNGLFSITDGGALGSDFSDFGANPSTFGSYAGHCVTAGGGGVIWVSYDNNPTIATIARLTTAGAKA